ncbi:hypothetical protein FZZ91_06295 [Synechococcus sp. HB1133]|uniref:HdeD family acid-resistance protein n=1 Tax=unclassified Synechococcus TaxID=2626047 RepID=UPI00140BE460|nr:MULTISPECIES: DUF308 domain-containing protein [unclassified Synechococcus]MCB4395285.1 hypothetical protein [Synechococcus sp. PH41509]MCB4422448.1 hypothetical protein [Synechococcus sp. HB1133]MCB4430590.1 hypothetical protein [Synechococcus sp. HBA1120]NHI81396.1 hypothetical protein [Synechococcus sp. HB1133]
MTSNRQRQLAAALLILGAVAAILLPFISATLLTLALGGIAFSAGVSQLLRLGQGNAPGKLFRVLSALLYIGGAIFILIDPIEGEISLTLFAGVVVLFEGIMELAAGATSKGPMAGLVLLDGLLSAGIGLLLVLEWPSDSVWALGTLFGITLLSSAFKLLQQPGGEVA